MAISLLLGSSATFDSNEVVVGNVIFVNGSEEENDYNGLLMKIMILQKPQRQAKLDSLVVTMTDFCSEAIIY